jgi:hypothetical protein
VAKDKATVQMILTAMFIFSASQDLAKRTLRMPQLGLHAAKKVKLFCIFVNLQCIFKYLSMRSTDIVFYGPELSL